MNQPKDIKELTDEELSLQIKTASIEKHRRELIANKKKNDAVRSVCHNIIENVDALLSIVTEHTCRSPNNPAHAPLANNSCPRCVLEYLKENRWDKETYIASLKFSEVRFLEEEKPSKTPA